MRKLVLATHNQGKLHELSMLLSGTTFRVVSLADLGQNFEVEETGTTFAANAIEKAVRYSQHTPELTLADDSGLEVAALDGAPGVRSGRYGGPGLNDEKRCTKLLAQMETVRWDERSARFVCVLALAQAGGLVKTFEGVVEGLIAHEPRGTSGFGYDPIFYYPPKARTFGELTRAEKDAVSHRGQALRAFLSHIETMR